MTPPSNKQTRKATESAARERAAALKAAARPRRPPAQADGARWRRSRHRGHRRLVVAIPLLSGGTKKPNGVLHDVAAAGAATAPPWAAPANTQAQVNLAGLALLPNEAVVRHDHIHLDIFVDGKPQTVPAYIGIEGGANATGLRPAAHPRHAAASSTSRPPTRTRGSPSARSSTSGTSCSPRPRSAASRPAAARRSPSTSTARCSRPTPASSSCWRTRRSPSCTGPRPRTTVKVPSTYKWGDL